MTALRRKAVYQLVVVGLTAVAVPVMYASTGNVMASLAGFAVLGLLRVRPVMTRRGERRPVYDERDVAILHRATRVGHTALWSAMVIWGVGVTLSFGWLGDSGHVPLVWVAPVVWVAWWLVTGVRSLAILVLDSRGP